MGVKSKMTAIADRIRALLGITNVMGLDSMASNLDECQSAVDLQADLLDQAISAIADKAAGSKSPVLQSKTASPSEAEQIITPDDGFDALSSVSIDAISSTYIGSDISRLAEKVYTPGVNNYIIPEDVYLSGAQIILGDQELLPENIKQGVEIFGVEGEYTVESSDTIDTTDATATSNDIADGETAYINNQKITGSVPVVNSYLCYSTGSIDSTGEAYVSEYQNINGRLILEDNAVITYKCDANEFGDATAEDVASGKTFTSRNGTKLTGTKSDSAGLPSGISAIATGTFKLSSSTNTYSISHDLGVAPNFLNIIAEGDISCSDFADYVICCSIFNLPVNFAGGLTPVNGMIYYGTSDNFFDTTYISGGPASSYFSDTSVDTDSIGKEFKAGVTYRWICGLVDF